MFLTGFKWEIPDKNIPFEEIRGCCAVPNHRSTMLLLLTTLVVSSGVARGGGQTIMPLGDSITEGSPFQNSYRRPLWHMLQSVGYDADFIGSRATNEGSPPPDPDFDPDHEGHSGWTTDEILNGWDGEPSLAEWLAVRAPDVVLLHLGTNDILSGQANASTADELGQVIDTLRGANPSVTVLIAQIIPAAGLAPAMEDLNARIAQLAVAKDLSDSPIRVVDLYSGFDPTVDTYDGVHPNASGELKMADGWYAALSGLPGGPVGTPIPFPPPPVVLQARSFGCRMTAASQLGGAVVGLVPLLLLLFPRLGRR